MPAVVKVIEDVVDVVTDVVGTIIDVVVDVVDWVVDEIVEPVVKGVVDVIDYALDNPIEALATLAVTIGAPYLAPFIGTTAATLTAAAKWVIPLASGTQTLINGGSLGDAVKSAAISFAGTYATGAVAKLTSPTIQQVTSSAIKSTQLATTVANVLEAGTKSATKTFVASGGDPKAAFKAFTNAVALGGVNAGLEAATDAVMGGIEQSFLDSDLGKSVNDLSAGVKESIYASVAAELTGQDLSPQDILAALDKEGYVSNLVDKYVPLAGFMDGLIADAKDSLGENLSDVQVKILSDAVGAAWNSAKMGNPDLSGEAFFGKMQEEAYEDLIDTLSDPIDEAIDGITGNSAKARAAAEPLNIAMRETTEATSAFNALSKDLNGRIAEQERLKGVYNTALAAHNANPTQATQDAANIASADFNNHANSLGDDYPNIKKQLDAYQATYDKYEPTIEGLQAAYDEESKYVMQDIEDLDAALKPMLTGVQKTIATTMRPGIDADKYRELNGLEAGEDVYAHYLSNIGTAQVFDPADLNKEAGGNLYGEGYTASYDEFGDVVYLLDTPDGKKKVDPYLEGVGGGRGGDPRDFNDGVWSMQDYRKKVADPVALGGRLTYDMASVAGDASRQGQIITLNDFKKLKDAGYNVTAFKDKFTGETINGDQSYDDILANHMQERARLGSNYKKPEPTGSAIDFAGYTVTTEAIHNDVIGYWKSTGMSDEDAAVRAAETAPIGEVLNSNSKFSDNSSLTDLVAFRDYIDLLDEGVDSDGDPVGKYNFMENADDIAIAEALRLGETDGVTDFLSNTAGLGLDAIGQLAQTFSYAVILSNAAGLTDTAAEDTWLSSFGEVLSDAGKGIQTDEYKAKVAKLNEDMATAMSETEGFWGTTGAIMSTAWNNPTAFVSEYIVSELFQELPLLVATGGTSLVARLGVKGGASLLGKEFTETALKRAGLYGAVAGGTAGNIAEGFGGGAGDGYDKGLATYNDVTIKGLLKQGLAYGEAKAVIESPAHLEKAEKYASDLAMMAGLIGGGIALVTAGLAAKSPIDNMALEKALFGDRKAPDGFIDQLKGYAEIVAKESASEGLVEEGGISAFIEGRLSLIDPTRDVSGNITAAALLGAMAGGPTAGSIKIGADIVQAGSTVATAMALTQPDVFFDITGLGNGFGGAFTYDKTSGQVKPKPTIEEMKAAAEKNNIDVATTTELLNINHDTEIVTKEEVKEYVKLVNPELEFTDEIAEGAYKELVGETKESDIERLTEQYLDPFYVTREEAKEAAEKEGVTLTEEQVDDLVGTKPEEDLEDTIIEKYDDSHTSRTEAEQFYADLGYTPSEQEILDRVGATPDADQKIAIEEYVNPRQVTEAESRAFFEATGYVGTNEEILNRVGQGNDNFATKTETDIGAYVDPRMVSDAEARQFFADLGYENPTDEQVAQFVAQVSETEQAGVVAKYVDPRQVTRDEVQAIADEEGLTLTDALAATYVGQGVADNYAADKLAGARTEYDPLATTEDEAAAFFAATDYTATPEEIANFVASKTEEIQKSAIGGYVDPRQMTAEEAEAFLSEIGYNPDADEIARFTGQLNDATYQTTQKAAIDEYVDPRYVDAGEIRAAYEELGLVDVEQADIDRFVGQFDEETQLEAVREYAPVATTNIIRGIIGSPSVEDNPDTDVDESKDATGIYRELEDGATRDEALEAALAKLTTDLGLTEDALLDQLGITKDELSDEIDVVAKDVADVKEDVTEVKEEVGEVKEDVGDLADILGTAGVEDDPTTELTDESKDATGLFATIKAYEDAGFDRDTALQKAIDEVSTALGTSKTDLLAAIGETETTLTEEIEGVETALTGDITALGVDLDTVAQFVGKPAREVTQTDIDFVTDLIAQENVSEELTLQYDVTGDGIVDIADQNLLTDTLQGTTDTTLADTSIFDPATGLFLKQEQDTQTTLDAITDVQTDINTQIDTQTKTQNVNQLAEMLAGADDLYGQQVTTTPGEKAQIDYLYDIGGDNIFATEQQAGLFASPYGTRRVQPQPANNPMGPMARASGFAQGGQVEDENDRLLRLLGEL